MTKILSGGVTGAREQTRARVLDLLDRKEHPFQIAESLKISPATVYNVQSRYLAGGAEAALRDKPRSGKPPTITGEQKARITALACSDAPEGHSRWTLRLLADRRIELGFVESISHMEIGRILKKLAKVAFEEAVVHRTDNGRISCTNGRRFVSLQSAV